MHVELVYFNAHARGEVTRLCYAAAGRGDELLDTRLPLFLESDLALTTWLEHHKPASPFGHLPYLNVRDAPEGAVRQIYGDGVLELFVARHLGLLGDSFASEGICGTIAAGAASILSDDLMRAGLRGDSKAVREAVSPSQPVRAVLAYLEQYIGGTERDYIVDERITLADLAIFNAVDALVMGPRGDRVLEGVQESLIRDFPALMRTFAVVSRDLKAHLEQRQLKYAVTDHSNASDSTDEHTLQSALPHAKGSLSSDRRHVSFGAKAAAAAAAGAIAIRGAARAHPLAQTLSIQEEARKQASMHMQMQQDTRWETNCRHVDDASLWHLQQTERDTSACSDGTVEDRPALRAVADESWMQPIDEPALALAEPNARNQVGGKGNFSFSAITVGATRAHPLTQTLALQEDARKQLVQRQMQMQQDTRWEANRRHVDEPSRRRLHVTGDSKKASAEDAAGNEAASVDAVVADHDEDGQIMPKATLLLPAGSVGLAGHSAPNVPKHSDRAVLYPPATDPVLTKSPAKSLSLRESIRRRSEGDGSHRIGGLLSSMTMRLAAARSSLSDPTAHPKEGRAVSVSEDSETWKAADSERETTPQD